MPQALATVRETSSPSVEETVSISVADFLALVRRSAWLIACCALATILLAAAFLAMQTPLYRATSQIFVDPQALQVVGKDIVRNDTAASIDFANIDSQALVMTSNSVLDQLIDELKLEDDPALAPAAGRLSRLLGKRDPERTRASTLEALRKSIVVRRVDNSLVFELTASHPDAAQAAIIANRLAAIYLRQGSDGRAGAVKRANDSLLGQLASLRQQLNEAETAVEKFRSANNLISTGEAGLLVNQQLKDLYAQITTAETELARVLARKATLAKLGPDALLSDRIPEALNSPTIIALRTQYASTAREAARMAETLLPRHPQLMEARGELTASRKLLADELDRIRASVTQEHQQAQANVEQLKERAKGMVQSQVSSSESEIKLRQLESEADAIRSVYNASLARAKELEQQAKIETSNSRLISQAAIPLKPSKAPAVIVLPAAALFGGCLGLSIGFLLNLLAGSAPNARAAAEMFGIRTYASLRLRPGATGVDDADRPALMSVARRLQDHVGQRNPAIVLVIGAPELDAAARRSVIVSLSRALSELGEGVWFCLQGDRGEPTHIERIKPLHTVAGELLAPANGPLARAARSARGSKVMASLQVRGSIRGEGAEFLLLSDDDASDLAGSASSADAVIVLFEPGKTRRRTMRDLVGLVDPMLERTVAVVGVTKPAKVAFPLPNPVARRLRKAFA